MSKLSFNLNIDIDENGYIDYECPEEKCLSSFKIHNSNEILHEQKLQCPHCGIKGSRKNFFTTEQVEMINNNVEIMTENIINDALVDMRKSFGSNKNIRMKKVIGHARKLSDINVKSMNPIEYEIGCSNCSTRYALYRIGTFCPVCHETNESEILTSSLNAIMHMQKNITIVTGDCRSDSISRDLQNEICFNKIASALHSYLYVSFVKRSSSKCRANDFQIIEKARELFNSNVSINIFSKLYESEVIQLHYFFQIRHCFEHNNGIIDEKFIEKTKTNKKCGTKLAITSKEIDKFIYFCNMIQIAIEQNKTASTDKGVI